MPLVPRRSQIRPSGALALALAAACVDATGPYSIPRAVTTPVLAAGGARYVAIASGFFHSCALDAGGKAWCWGDDAYQQLGVSDGTVPCDDSRCVVRPVAVATTLRFTAISAGVHHSCAIAIDGAAWCWGGGVSPGPTGMLGDGRLSTSAEPVAVSGGLRFSAIAAGGRMTCGIATDERGWCWGAGGFVGSGDTATALAPTPLAGGLRLRAIAVGTGHACAVTTEGEVWCWGLNSYGELGPDAPITDILADPRTITSPVRVPAAERFVAVGAGGTDFTCGLTESGTALCWGYDHVGELGYPADRPFVPVPHAVAGSQRFTSLTTGAAHVCTLTADGAAWCWGGNWFGTLGDGGSTAATTSSERDTPGPVHTDRRFTAIAAGGSHNCALALDHTVWCWGDQARGQMGN